MTTYLLILVIIIMTISHRLERKDLYNRIMSKDIREYKAEPIKKDSVQTLAEKNIKKWQGKEV